MEDDVGSSSPSSGTPPGPGQSSTTSPAKVEVNIGVINPPSGIVGVGGCSETANATAEGKRLKTDMTGDGGEDVGVAPSSGVGKPQVEKKDTVAVAEEASGSGSGMPPPVRKQLHPLENPVILTHLFERCPLELLAQCRLVSKRWWDTSLSSWRANSLLTVKDMPYGVHYPAFQKYLEFMTTPEGECGRKPHRKMRLDGWSWRKVDPNRESRKQFWKWFGGNLTSLEFRYCHFDRAEDLRGVIFGSLPNLRRLCLHRCSFAGSAPVPVEAEGLQELEYVEPAFGEQTNLRSLSVIMPGCSSHFNRLPFHWLELLSHFPSLTSLKVSLSHEYLESSDGQIEELLKAIQIMRQRDERKLPLRSFELDPPLIFYVGILPDPSKGLQLPLQALDIQVDSTKPRMHPLLGEFLSRHSSTLTQITVTREVVRDDSIISRFPFSWGHFPSDVMLEKLEELRVHMLFPSMEFLKYMPNLKKLEFLEPPGFGYSKKKEARIFPEQGPPTLAEVKLSHLTEFRMDYKVTLEDVPILARLMPNVTKLTMTLNDELFSRVCQSWGNLREMEVLGEELTDKGVTGVDARGKETASATNITNLQGLERFHFWSLNLTDRSVFQGFAELPSLKHLRACGGRISLGARAKKALSDNNVSIEGEDYDCNELVDEDDHDF